MESARGKRSKYDKKSDYLLIDKRYRNEIRRARINPGSDIGSDYNLMFKKLEYNIIPKKKAGKT